MAFFKANAGLTYKGLGGYLGICRKYKMAHENIYITRLLGI